jgi:hypothetical protein
MTQAIELATKQAERFDEDPVGNFLLAAELAPRLCPGCANYHMQYTARRASRYTSGDGVVDALDRPELTEILTRLFAERAKADTSPIQVTLAGSADAGLLSMVANAADAAGKGIVERSRFVVLDRCPTPLVLCASFGRRYALDVEIRTMDLLGPEAPAPADLLVVHSVFRFVPHGRHVELLGRLMSWLKPGGKLVFSMGIGRRGRGESAAALAAFGDLFRREVSAGRIPFPRPVEPFLAGLEPANERVGDIIEAESIGALFRDAGVRVEAWQEIQGDPRQWAGRNKRRALAVLSRPD